MTYTEAKQIKEQAYMVSNVAEQAWKAIRNELLIEQGLTAAANGLTPDSVKFHPAYKAAQAVYDKAFANERAVNTWFSKAFKKEYAAERKAKYDSMCKM